MNQFTGNLYVDHSRADMERRMKILELAGGNIEHAKELYSWVLVGDPVVNCVVRGNGIQDLAELRK